MKPTLAIIAATAGLANAQMSLEIDLSGAQFFDAHGSAINETMHIVAGASASITNIAWDVNLTTLTAPGSSFQSWASEATMEINGAFSLAVGTGDNFGVVNQNYAGSADVNLVLGPDGFFIIEFWDSFDDALGLVDAYFEEGSTLTITCSNCYPTPGSLAALSLAGLAYTRRRR